MSEQDERARVLEAAGQALRLVCATLPHLAGLAHVVRVEPDGRVGSAGVFPSGRLLVNPSWFLGLAPREAAFVIAHELLHLALRTHQRAGEDEAQRFNAAHDYIINDMLEDEIGIEPPGGGLRRPGARYLSAESIAAQLGADDAAGSFEDDIASPLGLALRDALRRQVGADHDAIAAHGSDVLSSELERRWFPDQPTVDLEAAVRQVERVAAQAVSLEQLQERAREAAETVLDQVYEPGDGARSGPSSAYASALKTMYRPPWEMALHRWLDAVSPGARTYTRASRRGAERLDVVLPGRLREGWTLSIVLDTSGSMGRAIGRALGVIASFCEAAGVQDVRVVQCDERVMSDEVVAVDNLARYEIRGFGGSDMSPALWRLAADAEVEAAIVITDGDIGYPESPMPYPVLWVLTQDADWFEPPYGQVIDLTP